MNEQIVLFGAGACGGYALRHLRAKGIEPAAIVDNSPAKWGTSVKGSTCVDGIEGVRIMDPEMAQEKFPNAEWVACAINHEPAMEIRSQLKKMGVKTKPLWECLPVCHGVPPESAYFTLRLLLDEMDESVDFLQDQISFRSHPNYDTQCAPADIKDIYFPDFITHLDDEHFVDAGCADGDTIREFVGRWPKWGHITGFEPDNQNFNKALRETPERVDVRHVGVSDHYGQLGFVHAGDYSSHLDRSIPVTVENAEDTTYCIALDDARMPPPTYMKFDIEGEEPNALWGAKRLLKEHRPVLAVCAYHASEHLWSLPLLIHALQPEYRLFLRRYAEGAFELVWYAVPPERVR